MKKARKYNYCNNDEEFNKCFDKWIKDRFPELKSFYREYCVRNNLYPMSESMMFGRFKTICKISVSNIKLSENDFERIVDEYYMSKSTKRKQDILYGEGYGKKFSSKLRESLANNKTLPQYIEYWINKGLTSEEAKKAKMDHYNKLIIKLSEINKANYINDPAKYRERYKNREYKNQKQYWIIRGYTEEESLKIVKAIQLPYLNTLEELMKRHGESKGREIHASTIEKRKTTRLRNHGTLFFSSHVSKASLKYFKPLYKILRKSGVARVDINWGIGKQKEFITKDSKSGKNFAYDFVIRSKKVIIEYNDPFWHANKKEDWRNPHTKYEDSLKFDNYKREVVERLGFKIIYVWADDLPDIQTLTNIILNG